MFSRKNGQAALEFLLTYGWAFMVILGVLVAIYQLDVLGSTQTDGVTTRCDNLDLIICDDQRSRVYEDGIIQLTYQNRGRESYKLSTLQITEIDGEQIAPASCVERGTLRKGERIQIECVDVGEFDFVDGERSEVAYEIGLTPIGLSEAYTKTYTGRISAEVQSGQPRSRYEETPADLTAILNTMAGEGNPGNPYQVTNVYHLQAMNEERDAHYALQNDVHARGTKSWNNGKGFLPIGNVSTQTFTGFFQGNGHTIHNLYIRRPTESYVGLFRRNSGAEGFENFTIKSAYVQGDNNVGAFSGHNARGSRQIRGVNNVVAGNSNVGGLVGGVHLRSLRELGVIGGSVTGSTNVGGVVGSLGWSDIRNSYARTTVSGNTRVGGLVGSSGGGNSYVIENNYAASDIPGSGQALVGRLGSNHEVINSYYNNALPGAQGSTHGTPLPQQNMTGETAATELVGFDFNTVWKTTKTYPDLR
jgi:hypothetical protein